MALFIGCIILSLFSLLLLSAVSEILLAISDADADDAADDAEGRVFIFVEDENVDLLQLLPILLLLLVVLRFGLNDGAIKHALIFLDEGDWDWDSGG